jgi:hypothetical protein
MKLELAGHLAHEQMRSNWLEFITAGTGTSVLIQLQIFLLLNSTSYMLVTLLTNECEAVGSNIPLPVPALVF